MIARILKEHWSEATFENDTTKIKFFYRLKQQSDDKCLNFKSNNFFSLSKKWTNTVKRFENDGFSTFVLRFFDTYISWEKSFNFYIEKLIPVILQADIHNTPLLHIWSHSNP